jgi:hypothetical protein
MILSGLKKILHLPVPFVGHYLKAELFCCFQLGLEAPADLWDTWVFEKFTCLGRFNPKYKLKKDSVSTLRFWRRN